MKKFGLGLLAVITLLALAIIINPQINPNHDTPYFALQAEVAADMPADADVIQRVLLYGDAGHSTMDPWQESMKRVAERAKIAPEKTSVFALGDNIYMRGYPKKDADQTEWDEGQLESISFLDAQLKIATESGAKMFLVPGNHDWYAEEVDGQTQHIAAYARANNVQTEFRPQNVERHSELASFPGVSLVFIDSQALIQADADEKTAAMAVLEQQLRDIRQQYPQNLILAGAHHPLITEGQHAGYMTHFAYWIVIKVLYTLFDVDQDTYHEPYKKMIAALNGVFGKFDRVIYSAGHEHSLQVFRLPDGAGPDYQLVSGAGNTSKVSGVWHNEFSRFALSQEGFMELNITADNRVHLSVFDIHHPAAVAGFWLDFGTE